MNQLSRKASDITGDHRHIAVPVTLAQHFSDLTDHTGDLLRRIHSLHQADLLRFAGIHAAAVAVKILFQKIEGGRSWRDRQRLLTRLRLPLHPRLLFRPPLCSPAVPDGRMLVEYDIRFPLHVILTGQRV